MLVILHDLNLAARYCDRILLLEGGRPHALDTPANVLRPEPLKAVFGLDVLVQPHPERGHPLIIAQPDSGHGGSPVRPRLDRQNCE